MKFGKSLRLLILVIVLAIVVALFMWLIKPRASITVIIPHNEIVLSNFPFIPEHWKEEKLAQLRTQENYQQIKATTQFDYFLKLCDWTHNQWPRSVPDPYPLSNALSILAEIRAKKTGGFCGQYAYVLADVLKSLGFFAVRYVELWSKKGESHFVVEAWCDQYAKWVILDPDQDIYYRLGTDGPPANAYEIRNSIFDPGTKIEAINIADGSVRKEETKIQLYANFAVSLRSDLLRHSKPLTVQDRFDMFLFFKDQHTTETAFERFATGIPYRLVTDRVADLYYDCNRVRLTYSIIEPGKQLLLSFFNDGSMANFQGFEVSLDHGKSWLPSSWQYTLHGEKETKDLWVRPKNMYQRKGCITMASIIFH